MELRAQTRQEGGQVLVARWSLALKKRGPQGCLGLVGCPRCPCGKPTTIFSFRNLYGGEFGVRQVGPWCGCTPRCWDLVKNPATNSCHCYGISEAQKRRGPRPPGGCSRPLEGVHRGREPLCFWPKSRMRLQRRLSILGPLAKSLLGFCSAFTKRPEGT